MRFISGSDACAAKGAVAAATEDAKIRLTKNASATLTFMLAPALFIREQYVCRSL
jgi:hypothetical protein